MDLPRSFVIRESGHRILNPFTDEKLAALGRAVGLRPGMHVMDLASGKGELLCTWARNHGIIGTSVDISSDFTRAAQDRAVELGVADRVTFLHGDAGDDRAHEPVDVASCCGATWIGGGPIGTLRLLERSLRRGGLALVGEPFWLAMPTDRATVEGRFASTAGDYLTLPALVAAFGSAGWDLVEMVLVGPDSFDRYVAAHWLTIRRWLDEHPGDELAGQLRVELTTDPLRYVTYERPNLGWRSSR